MKQLIETYRRFAYVLVAALLLAVVAVPSFWSSHASAAGQITGRKITLSSSTPSASSVTYTLVFTPVSAAADMFIDFCDNTPLIGDSCTATAGTDTPNVSGLTASNVTGCTGLAVIAGNHALRLTGCSLTGGTQKTITITGITNPSNSGSIGDFYSRVLTYASGNAASVTTSQTPGTYVDYGGIALTTTNNITITSKVFETLSFCVYQTSCTSGNGNAANLTLGDPTTQALSISNNYINSNALYTLATNAGSGVAVVLKGNTLCRDPTPANCTTGSADPNTITPKAAGAATVLAAAGNEQFAMCANKNGSTALTVASTYDDTVNNCASLTTGTYSGTSKFGWDNAAATGSSGSSVMTSSGAVPSVSGNFTFAAGIAATTEAGIYTASINMIATGTF